MRHGARHHNRVLKNLPHRFLNLDALHLGVVERFQRRDRGIALAGNLDFPVCRVEVRLINRLAAFDHHEAHGARR